MTSPNGITWTSRTGGEIIDIDNRWSSVCYGNGKFVAISNIGTFSVSKRIIYSYDGITWINTDIPDSSPISSVSWESVCYGNGKYVAVTSGERYPIYSNDGITWYNANTTTLNYWQSVCYGNGLFVAVANNGSSNRVMTSSDGINWTDRSAATNISWESVCYGNGLFVAVSTSGTSNRVMTSLNGINWASRSSAKDYEWRSVCYGNGLFVAVSNTGVNSRVMTSGKQYQNIETTIVPWIVSNNDIKSNLSGTCYATAFVNTSDYRIKENVQNLDETFSIDDLRPVTYFNKKLEKYDMGFIAHEVKEIFPFLVNGEKDDTELQSLNYSGFIALLVKEIQGLKQENKLLKSKIEEIKEMI
jgi:hypothetical protein